MERSREVVIRKVLGISVSSVLCLLSKDFLKLIAVEVVLAIPLAYYGMDKWLSRFAFRIELQWYIFAVPALLVLIVALTVSFQTSRAAKANPVNSLRSE